MPWWLHLRMTRLAPIAAAILFGSWAAIVNSIYGPAVMLRSGVGQGLYALAATWLVTRTACSVYRRTGRHVRGWLAGFSASLGVMLVIPLTIHSILRTPEIVAAMLPGILWGIGYVCVLLASLSRSESRNDN